MASTLDTGVRIADKYEILGPLGRGAYGNVYRALQHPVEREVAIKLIAPHAAANEALRSRFVREARAIARLNHPGAVTLHDYGDHDGQLYMVMEKVEGTELKAIIKEEAPLPMRRAVEYARQVLTVLVEAHRLDLVHRDLKPANIMVIRDAAGGERIKILDFGIAKLLDDGGGKFQTQMGTVVGSPSYFSPEQAMGEPVGKPADQYSVGVLLFEMLTGRKPFVGSSLMALVSAHRYSPVPPLPANLGVPAALEAFIKRAMEKQPSDRFADARAMLEALDAVHAGHLTSDRPPDVRPTVRMNAHAAMAQLADVSRSGADDPVRARKMTQPLPGLAEDEASQQIDVSSLADIEPPPAESPRRTAFYTGGSSVSPLPGGQSGSGLHPTVGGAGGRRERAPRLPGVDEFSRMAPLPPLPRRRSPIVVGLIAGGLIGLVGILILWAINPAPQPAPAEDAPYEEEVESRSAEELPEAPPEAPPERPPAAPDPAEPPPSAEPPGESGGGDPPAAVPEAADAVPPGDEKPSAQPSADTPRPVPMDKPSRRYRKARNERRDYKKL